MSPPTVQFNVTATVTISPLQYVTTNSTIQCYCYYGNINLPMCYHKQYNSMLLLPWKYQSSNVSPQTVQFNVTATVAISLFQCVTTNSTIQCYCYHGNINLPMCHHKQYNSMLLLPWKYQSSNVSPQTVQFNVTATVAISLFQCVTTNSTIQCYCYHGNINLPMCHHKQYNSMLLLPWQYHSSNVSPQTVQFNVTATMEISIFQCVTTNSTIQCYCYRGNITLPMCHHKQYNSMLLLPWQYHSYNVSPQTVQFNVTATVAISLFQCVTTNSTIQCYCYRGNITLPMCHHKQYNSMLLLPWQYHSSNVSPQTVQFKVSCHGNSKVCCCHDNITIQVCYCQAMVCVWCCHDNTTIHVSCCHGSSTLKSPVSMALEKIKSICPTGVALNTEYNSDNARWKRSAQDKDYAVLNTGYNSDDASRKRSAQDKDYAVLNTWYNSDDACWKRSIQCKQY